MTREEFIGKLRSIYVGEKNAIDEIISEYDRLKEVIEKKDTFYDSLAVDYRLAQEEIDRLNNIINELEKWLNEDEYFNGRKLRKDYITVLVTDVLDKLKALKEDNNGK